MRNVEVIFKCDFVEIYKYFKYMIEKREIEGRS